MEKPKIRDNHMIEWWCNRETWDPILADILNMVTWECVRRVGGENINRSQVCAGCLWGSVAIIIQGRSHLRPCISAAAINPSSFTHFGGSKYWDTSNYRQFRAQLSCFTVGSHRDSLDGVKDKTKISFLGDSWFLFWVLIIFNNQ